MSTESITVALSLTYPRPQRMEITIPKTTTPAKLHELASQKSSIPLEGLKLIYRGRIISKDNDDEGSIVIDLFNLEEGSVIHCMGRPTAPSASDITSQSTTTATSAPGSASIGSTVSPPSNTTAPSTASSTTAASSSSISTPLETALSKIATSNQSSPSDHLLAVETILKITTNITSHPMEEKYRSVKSTNPAFVKRLGRHDGSQDLMAAIGFEILEEKYVLKANPEAWSHLVSCQSIMEGKVQELKRRNSSQVGSAGNINPSRSPLGNNNNNMGANPFGSMMGTTGMGSGMGGGMGSGMGGGMGNMNPSDMANAMNHLRNNPEQVRAMMQNPMVQQMIRNDPRMANNPMMQQGLDAMLNNPQMLEQAARMMGDPTSMARMEQMEQMTRAFGGGGVGSTAGGMGMPPANNGATNNVNFAQQMQMMQQMMGGSGAGTGTGSNGTGTDNTSQGSQSNNASSGSSNQANSNSNSGGDQDMTEEEMIAEAIARSLRDS